MKNKIYIAILVIVIVLAGLTFFLLKGNDDKGHLTVKSKTGVSVTYSNKVSFESTTAKLYFKNPEGSNQKLIVAVVFGNNVLAKSDFIAPGEELNEITLEESIGISSGTYVGNFLIQYYDLNDNMIGMDATVEAVIDIK